MTRFTVTQDPVTRCWVALHHGLTYAYSGTYCHIMHVLRKAR